MANKAHRFNEKRQVNHQDEQEIAQAFAHMLVIVKRYVEQLCDRVFVVTKRSISFKIMMASGNARLNGCDEKTYECYMYLMRQYQVLGAIYEQNQDITENPRINNIITGIHSVLASRVRMMVESDQNPKENPIAAEKRDIVNKSVQFSIKNFDLVQKQYGEALAADVFNQYSGANLKRFDVDVGAHMIDTIIGLMFERCGKDCYNMTQDSIKFCLISLNDINSRKAITTYYELLSKELEILTSIVKVQIKAVEAEFEQMDTNNAETAAISAFLSGLSETYQFYGRGVQEINACFREAEQKKPVSVQDFDSFIADFDAQINSEQIFPTQIFEVNKKAFDEKRSTFEHHLNRAIDYKIEKQIGKHFQQQNNYYLQKTVAENSMMAEEMVHAFFKIIEKYNAEQVTLAQCENAEIVAGIFETIDIKIENLKENTQLYVDSCQTLMEQAKAEAETIVSGDQRQLMQKAAVDKVMNELIQSNEATGVTTPKLVRALLATCLEAEETENSLKRMTNAIESRNNAMHKKSISFKRDSLFYEMSTFEEIINYSVSRLKESEDEAVMDYVDTIEMVSTMLFSVLSKNNITVIAPNPHEPFNAKEQEVLMAEKNDDFLKGEIIKVMNRGYKQDGIIMMRANVIAAK